MDWLGNGFEQHDAERICGGGLYPLAVLVERLHGALDGSVRGKVDFIKIDAEGEELRILQGAATFLATYSPLIEFENAILTPHLGASTEEAQDRAGEQIADRGRVAAVSRRQEGPPARSSPSPRGRQLPARQPDPQW